MNNLTDRELLLLIHSDILELKERTSSLETQVKDLSGRSREVEVTVYGDDKRKIKGVLYHIETMRATITKYKKWEFTAGFIVGSIGIVWGAFLAIKEFISK